MHTFFDGIKLQDKKCAECVHRYEIYLMVTRPVLCCVKEIRESSRCGVDYLRTEKSGNTRSNFCIYKFLTSTFNVTSCILIRIWVWPHKYNSLMLRWWPGFYWQPKSNQIWFWHSGIKHCQSKRRVTYTHTSYECTLDRRIWFLYSDT